MGRAPVTLDAPTAHFAWIHRLAWAAGQKAAIQTAKLGLKAAVVAQEKLGGCSVFGGTIPSKTLREAVLYLTGFSRRAIYGLVGAVFNYPALAEAYKVAAPDAQNRLQTLTDVGQLRSSG